MSLHERFSLTVICFFYLLNPNQNFFLYNIQQWIQYNCFVFLPYGVSLGHFRSYTNYLKMSETASLFRHSVNYFSRLGSARSNLIIFHNPENTWELLKNVIICIGWKEWRKQLTILFQNFCELIVYKIY